MWKSQSLKSRRLLNDCKIWLCLLTLQWLPLPKEGILKCGHRLGDKTGLFKIQAPGLIWLIRCVCGGKESVFKNGAWDFSRWFWLSTWFGPQWKVKLISMAGKDPCKLLGLPLLSTPLLPPLGTHSCFCVSLCSSTNTHIPWEKLNIHTHTHLFTRRHTPTHTDPLTHRRIFTQTPPPAHTIVLTPSVPLSLLSLCLGHTAFPPT